MDFLIKHKEKDIELLENRIKEMKELSYLQKHKEYKNIQDKLVKSFEHLNFEIEHIMRNSIFYTE